MVDISGDYGGQDPYAEPYEDPLYGQEDDDEDDTITQEDCWIVINRFFEEKGLVRQQLASYEEFIAATMQEIVQENAELILDQASQYTGHSTDVTRRYEIKFVEIKVSHPTISESDGTVVPLFPQEARLRNLTYASPLWLTMEKRVMVGEEDPEGLSGDLTWTEETGQATEDLTRVLAGRARPLSFQSSSHFNLFLPSDAYHAALQILHPSHSFRQGHVRPQRVPI